MERRAFVKKAGLSTAGFLTGSSLSSKARLRDIEFLNPQNRVPVSFIIDDSTALVNLAYYGIPQFQEVFPDRYKQDWRSLPQEIPDSFVLKFLEWCDAHGVKGKYSMVPYPACTGWLNRFIPGWTKKELDASIKIIRELAQPNWDIHSEMISHTRVIDTKTGLPFPQATPAFMENWEWSQEKSADELGEYIAYSLQILKDTGLHCDGVTTPGGFATRNIPNLAKGTQYAVKEVYGGQIAHFFRNLYTEPGKSVQPEIFHAKDLGTKNASCSVHIIGCTGDWFGGWDGLNPGDPDKFITPDLSKGRMVEVIESGEPAIMVCHWPGIYYNGEELGFNIFKTVVDRLHQRYDHLTWMKLSEIASYWAARAHTNSQMSQDNDAIFNASFATNNFTVRLPHAYQQPILSVGDKQIRLKSVDSNSGLVSNSWYVNNDHTIVCFDLHQGRSIISEA